MLNNPTLKAGHMHAHALMKTMGRAVKALLPLKPPPANTSAGVKLPPLYIRISTASYSTKTL